MEIKDSTWLSLQGPATVTSTPGQPGYVLHLSNYVVPVGFSMSEPFPHREVSVRVGYNAHYWVGTQTDLSVYSADGARLLVHAWSLFGFMAPFRNPFEAEYQPDVSCVDQRECGLFYRLNLVITEATGERWIIPPRHSARIGERVVINGDSHSHSDPRHSCSDTSDTFVDGVVLEQAGQ